MKRITMGMLIVSGSCIIGGVSLTAVGIASGGKVGLQITENGIRTSEDIQESRETTELLDSVRKLSLNVEGMYVEVSEGDTFALTLRCREDEYEVEKKQEDDSLQITIKQKEQPEAYVSVLDFDDASETSGIYLTVPKDCKLEALEILSDSEEINLEKVCTAELEIVNGSGCIRCEKVCAEEAVLQCSDGDIYGEKMQGNSLVTITKSANVSFDDIEYTTWTAKAEEGQLSGSRITIQNIDIQSEDGEVNLEELDTEDTSIVTGTGTVFLSLYDERENYHLKCYTKYGTIYAYGEDVMEDGSTAEYEQNPNAGKTIEVRSREGEINLASENMER